MGLLWGAMGAAAIGALFACADAALTSLTPARLGAVAEVAEGPRRVAIDRAIRARRQLQARYVVGRLGGLGTGVAAFTCWLVPWQQLGWIKAIVATVAILGLCALVQAAAGIGRANADRVVVLAVRFLRPLDLLLAPLATVSDDLGRLLSREVEAAPDPRIGETEVEKMLDERERTGELPQEPAEMMRNVLEFSDLTARDAMVARTRVVSLDIDTPIQTVYDIVKEAGHSRYPVYRDSPDDVVGLLYAKDLFRVMGNPWQRTVGGRRTGEGAPDEKATLRDLMRSPIQIVYETQPLSPVLKEMRQARQHLAVVVNEFGAMIGIVTLEDLLEEIVGDIRDELDTEEAPIVELGDGRLVADATVLLSELSAYLGMDIEADGESDSLGGMLTEHLGQVPSVGTLVVRQRLRFIVREADERRVLKVEIIRPPRPSIAPFGSPSEPPPFDLRLPGPPRVPPRGSDGGT